MLVVFRVFFSIGNYVQPGETIRTMDFMAGAPLKEATMDLFMVARLAPHFPALSFL